MQRLDSDIQNLMDNGENHMRQFKKFSLTTALMAASTTVIAHPGHEAIGDVLHVEYLFALGIAVAVALSAWKVIKQRR